MGVVRLPVVGRLSFWVVHLLLVCVLIPGCATMGAQDALRGTPSFEAALDEDGPALLLLMADQLLFEPFAVRTIFDHYPRLHEQLAVALGRIGDARGLPYLKSLLESPAVELRRAAAFGLGQLGDREAYPNLLGAVGDGDRQVGRLAVESLVRIGLPLATIEPALGVLAAAEIQHRLLPALFRFAPDEIHRLQSDLASQAGLQTNSDAGLDPGLERWLLYALARSGDDRGLPQLRLALDSQDPWIRGWAARGLGRLGERADLERLHRLLEDSRPGVVVQALRAASRLIDAGKVAPPDLWLADLERLIEDQRSWVRLTALESAGSWTPSPSLGVRLRALASGCRGRSAELALMSLARAGDIESEQLILHAAASEWPSMRRAAAMAAAVAGFEPVVEQLRADAEPAVRMAALTVTLERNAAASGTFSGTFGGALGGVSSSAEIAAREALLDSDPGIRTAALEWLASNPVAPFDELVLALAGAAEHFMPDLQVHGSSALAARALERPLERGAIVIALERLAESSDYIVRRSGGEALVSLGRERPPLGTVVSTRALRDYRAMASTIESSRWVELVTGRGVLVIELDTRWAPLSSISFIQLAEAGFFDGLEFHRVIPDFVAQGGDPRGDGWGGPGFSLRDENSWVPFERGVVGMARSGTHTAGSQFFLTLSSQPHLNGNYTAFGRVVAGEEWLDAIEQGDTISSIREVTKRD